MALSNSELIEVGAHTQSHPCLPAISIEEQQIEIAGSKLALEDLLGKRVRFFSYPYGQFTDQSMQIVQACGYEGACAARPASIRRCADRHQLPRVWARSRNGDQFQKFLDVSFLN